jgi:hypothetical protein
VGKDTIKPEGLWQTGFVDHNAMRRSGPPSRAAKRQFHPGHRDPRGTLHRACVSAWSPPRQPHVPTCLNHTRNPHGHSIELFVFYLISMATMGTYAANPEGLWQTGFVDDNAMRGSGRPSRAAKRQFRRGQLGPPMCPSPRVHQGVEPTKAIPMSHHAPIIRATGTVIQ